MYIHTLIYYLNLHWLLLDGARVQVQRIEEVGNEANKEHSDLPWYTAQEKIKKAEPVTDSGSLFIRNLWYSVTEEDLRELLEKYGKISCRE